MKDFYDITSDRSDLGSASAVPLHAVGLARSRPGWTFDQLRSEGFSDQVITALQSVTKRDGEDYMDFVQRAAAHPIGRQVKLADLTDNCDLARIAVPAQRDFDRIEKYRQAIALISTL